jgi:hypothetical protein
MKTTVSICRIAAGLLLILPGYSFTQNANIPSGQKARMHNEVPDDPWIPANPSLQRTGKAARVDGSGFSMVQVNVDGNGQNILGDAANEPSIAIDPTNPQVMVIGWRQFDDVSSNFRQAGWGYTFDGGLTWTFPGVIEPGIFRSDPVLGSDLDGKIFYNSLTSSNGFYYCKVFKSDDGGSSWNAGEDARGGDKQWMTIDQTTGMGSGNIYSSWTSYYSSCYPEFFTRSTDHGNYFDYCISIPGNPYWGTMTVGNNGELYVAGAGDWGGLIVAKSTNAQDPGITPTWDFATPVDLDGYLTAQAPINPVGLIGQASIDVDRSNGPGRDNLYVLASVTRYSTGDTADVMFSSSSDGGLTWTLPRRINDDPGDNRYQWFGTMSVAPNGRIDAIWLDTRDAGASPYISALYYSYSLDQGETWSVNEKLSDSFDPHIGYPQQDKMGDYFDMESDVSSAHLAWANTFNGEEDVYYSEITPVISGIAPGDENGICYLSSYPNPFSTECAVRYQVPVSCYVTLTLLDLSGREIRTLVSKTVTPGSYSLSLKGSDLPSGYYVCRMKAGTFTRTVKLVKI